MGRKRDVTDARSVAPCGLAYVSAGGGALWLRLWTVPPPPPVLIALSSQVCCVRGLVRWGSSSSILTFLGALNDLKRNARKSVLLSPALPSNARESQLYSGN